MPPRQINELIKIFVFEFDQNLFNKLMTNDVDST